MWTYSLSTAVKLTLGGVTPVLPSGTNAVGNGLYLRILSVTPPFLGMTLSSAGILWIMFGTGTDKSL